VITNILACQPAHPIPSSVSVRDYVQDRISTDQRFAAAVATLETQLAAQAA